MCLGGNMELTHHQVIPLIVLLLFRFGETAVQFGPYGPLALLSRGHDQNRLSAATAGAIDPLLELGQVQTARGDVPAQALPETVGAVGKGSA